MNVATGLGLFLVGSFALVAAFVVTSAIKYYLGAVVIFLLIGGVLFIWLNTVRQTEDMIKSSKQAEQPAVMAQEQQKKSSEAGTGGAAPFQEPAPKPTSA